LAESKSAEGEKATNEDLNDPPAAPK
jgi:hypothetical protein